MRLALFRGAKSAEELLLKAVVVSLAIHLAAFGGWRWGRKYMTWKPMGLPAWLTVRADSSKPPVLALFARNALMAKPPQPPQPPPVVSIYVDVDPSLAAAEPPVNTKYYSTANTLAANPEIKVASDIPNITGSQDKVMKTVAPAPRTVAPQPEAQPPLQPSPPEEKKPEIAGDKPLPKPAYTPGDLAEAKPAPKTQTTQGTAESESGSGAEVVPLRPRPRTVSDAREMAGAPGPRTKQEGGVNRLASDSSVDAARTVYGDYDRDFIDAVQSRWDVLLKGRQNNVAGTVVLEFNLHADGRISDMKRVSSDVNELQSLICQQAVLDPALYKPWPRQMVAVVKDPRPMRFTFYYSY
jgi:hypothetical protein